MVAMLVAAMIPGLSGRIRRTRAFGSKIIAFPGYRRLAAALRLLAYRKTRSYGKLFPSRSVGSLVIIFSFCIATIVWCFSITPYYRPNREWGSPPLAIRAGMMTQGMFPWLFALSMKVNPITVLTTISHERLQLYHQWLARLITLFGFIHTIPFLWQPNHDAAPDNLEHYWFEDYQTYWTGAVALALMFWMCLSSFGWARKLSYEVFVIVSAVGTFGALAAC